MAVEHVQYGVSANTSTPGQAEFNLKASERARKGARKKKEGTDGIEALDEREEPDRLKEGFELMSGEGY